MVFCKRTLEKEYSALGSWDERPARRRGTSTVRNTSRTSRSDIHSISCRHLSFPSILPNTYSTCIEPLSASRLQTLPPRRSWMASSRVIPNSTSKLLQRTDRKCRNQSECLHQCKPLGRTYLLPQSLVVRLPNRDPRIQRTPGGVPLHSLLCRCLYINRYRALSSCVEPHQRDGGRPWWCPRSSHE